MFYLFTKHQQPTAWVRNDDGVFVLLASLYYKTNGISFDRQIYFKFLFNAL